MVTNTHAMQLMVINVRAINVQRIHAQQHLVRLIHVPLLLALHVHLAAHVKQHTHVQQRLVLHARHAAHVKQHIHVQQSTKNYLGRYSLLYAAFVLEKRAEMSSFLLGEKLCKLQKKTKQSC